MPLCSCSAQDGAPFTQGFKPLGLLKSRLKGRNSLWGPQVGFVFDIWHLVCFQVCAEARCGR